MSRKSLRLRLLMAWLRHIEKPRLARIKDPDVERRAFERAARHFYTPPLTCYLGGAVGGVPGDWVWCRPRRDQVLLYLHGGAHSVGSPRTHRAMVARLCQWTGLRAFLPDIRLAPEHPFPAALEDAEQTWKGLIDTGLRPDQILLGGDSSGGGLAFALLSKLLKSGIRPAMVVGFAPWVDMTFAGASFAENADRDALLPVSQADRVRSDYLVGADPLDPRASPLFATYPDPPPVFLQAAKTELLRDDTLRLAEVLRGEGGKVSVDLWDDAPHVWAMFQGWVPEADIALRRTAAFIAAELPVPGSGGS